LKQIEAIRRLTEGERPLPIHDQGESFPWFRSKENQVSFMRNMQILSELDYEVTPEPGGGERREVQNKLRSITLFIFTGHPKCIGDLQLRMRLRGHDIVERYSRNELRGVLTHLKGVDPFEVEKMVQRLVGSREFSKPKCLLLPVYSHKDLGKDVLG
jgi:hypothetical protein